MSTGVPSIVPILVIGDDARLLAQTVTLLARKGAYLPLLDGPRVQRIDAAAEVIRRNNAAARAQPKKIIFAGLPASTCDLFSAHFPARRVQRIEKIDELRALHQDSHAQSSTPLTWGKCNLGLGLLRALRARQELVFDDSEAPRDPVDSGSGHLVVCEDGNEHAQVIAASYAYALNAGLCLIPSLPIEEAESILNGLYDLYEKGPESPTFRLDGLKARLRSHVGELPLGEGSSLTFITSKVPWGFAFPEAPSTHLFCYPDLGISIINGITAEQPDSVGVRVAAVIDPAVVDSTDVETALVRLTTIGVLSKALRSVNATVHTAAQMIELFPYDLLLISTHCGDASGWRRTYEYTDSEGLERTLVTDVAVGAEVIPGDENVRVTRFENFVSLDGVDWNDPEKKKGLYVGRAIIDFMERAQHSNDRLALTPTKQEPIPRVPSSMALRMADGNYIAAPKPIALDGSPIVINNACASWHRLAANFVFSNARAYIGTLFSVLDAEAERMIELLVGQYFGEPLSEALWRAQNELLGNTVRKPYVLVGCHFQRLRTTNSNAVRDVLARLRKAHGDWERQWQLAEQMNEVGRRRAVETLQYLQAEIDTITAFAGSTKARDC